MASKKTHAVPTQPSPRMVVPTGASRTGEALLDAINVIKNREYLVEEDDRPTRTAAKNAASQLERLGEQLVKLLPSQLARVELPDDLREAVVEAQRILVKNARGGYRRQVQFIGKIMRHVDAKPILAALEGLKDEGTRSDALVRQAELWRARLLDEGDVALEALVKERPTLDRTALRQLMRSAQAERAAGKPGRQQRELFRMLNGPVDD
jgi:ribosome-associated protein